MKSNISLCLLNSFYKEYNLNYVFLKNISYLFNDFICIAICEINNSIEIIIYDSINKRYIPFSGRLISFILTKDTWQELKKEAEINLELETGTLINKRAQVELLIHIYAFDRYTKDLMNGKLKKYNFLFENMSDFQIEELNRIIYK